MFVLAGVWFHELMRTFFFNIDKIVFNFISIIYDFLITIARTSILSQADILDMADRIYKLLAIFMIFKVTFSLIMYVVNPDDFSDKSKGITKLGTNIVISLSLLILTPYIFNYAYQLQTIILEDNSLAVLIFGEDHNNPNESVLESAGDKMAFISMSPFFTPDSSIGELYDCSQLMKNVDGKRLFNEECSGISNDDYDKSTGDSDSLQALTEKNDKFKETTLKNYVAGTNVGNLGLMFRQDMALATVVENVSGSEEEVFVMDYKYLFSTVTGVMIVLLLLSFCLDVAVRSVKLAFLQLVAPIPIISYVDPKSGKDGMFKKWYQMCFSTYISLFVRLLTLYFVIYIISRIDNMVDIVNGSYVDSLLVKIFVIIGCLMFAKQLPKILEGLGIKLDGDGKFYLNPIKKFQDQALGGKQILGFAGAAGAAGLAGTTNFASRLFDKNNYKNKDGEITAGSFIKGIGKGVVKGVGSGIAGTTSAMYRGSRKAVKGEGFGKTFSSSYGEAMFAKLQREDLSRKGSTIGGRIMADAARITGNLNAGQQQILDRANADAKHESIMNKFKADKEQIQREKTNQTAKLKEAETLLGRIDTRIGGTKAVKDAQEIVDSLKTSGKFYTTMGKKMEIELKQAEESGNSDLVNHYKEELKKLKEQGKYEEIVKTKEGEIADEQLDKEKKKAYTNLKNDDPEGKVIFEQLEKYKDEDGKYRIGDIEFNPEKEDGSFNKADKFNLANNISAIETKYSNKLSEISEAEAQEQIKFEEYIKEHGLDKNSPEWKANEADNAARRVKNPQQEGWTPSADVSNYVYDPRLGGGMFPPGFPPDGPGDRE